MTFDWTNCLICATVLMVALLALRPLLRRVSARLRYALWALVLLRLVLPVSLGHSGLSVMNFVPSNAGTTTQYTVETAPQADAPTAPTVETLTPEPTAPTVEAVAPSTGEVVNTPDATGSNQQSRFALRWWQIGWLSGSAVVGLGLLVANGRFARRVRRQRQWLTRAGRLPVYVAEGIPSPCLCGLLRPAVYVTPAVAADETQLAHVLAHETAHYRHGDLWWSLARGLCVAVWWFHPLVWVCAWLSRRDAELACDESALRALPAAQRIAYGRTLLALVADCEPHPRGQWLRLATTMAAGKGEITARIRAIARHRRTLAGAVALALVLVLVAVGCTFTGANDTPATEPDGATDPVVDTDTDPADDPVDDTDVDPVDDADDDTDVDPVDDTTDPVDDATVAPPAIDEEMILESDYPVLLLDDGSGAALYPTSRPELWDGIAYDQLSPAQVAAMTTLPTLYWNGVGSVAYTFSETPTALQLEIWEPGADNLSYWTAEELTPAASGTITLRSDGSYLFVLRATFARGTVEYLFCHSLTDAGGALRVYGTDLAGIANYVDYVDDRRLVFHGYYGLCVYDLEAGALLSRVDFLQGLGCNWLQGSTRVAVAISGQTALCHLVGDDGDGAYDLTRALAVDLTTGAARLVTYTAPAAETIVPAPDVALIQSGNRLCDLKYGDGAASWQLFDEGFLPAAQLSVQPTAETEPDPAPSTEAPTQSTPTVATPAQWAWEGTTLMYGGQVVVSGEEITGCRLMEAHGRRYALYHQGGAIMGTSYVIQLWDDGSSQTISQGQWTFFDLGDVRLRYERWGALQTLAADGNWVNLGAEGWIYGYANAAGAITDSQSAALIGGALYLVGGEASAEATGIVRVDPATGATTLVVDGPVRSFTVSGTTLVYEYYDGASWVEGTYEVG